MKHTSFQRYLEQLHSQYKDLHDGEVADYIPELGKADPDWFGIAVVTVDGHVYQAGDTRQAFSIQSISKAFTYGVALEDNGEQVVASKIDVEPSGEAFNSISLEPDTGRPRNPMINAGAIVATSLVEGDTSSAKLQRILDKFSQYTGTALEVDTAVYQSEKTTGHRNRAIAHLLRNYDILTDDPEIPLDAYFRQCSILVNARDLAMMGATLANDGVNPVSGIRVLESPMVSRVLSVMASCGMYDYSGNWIYSVGMPAKSGVGGGIVAVLPGQLSLAVFSPRLDKMGNSVRGIAVCEAFSRNFGLHMLRVTRTTTTSVINASYTCAKVRSKLSRSPECESYLRQEGDRILVLELTGELMFVPAEIITNTVMEQVSQRDFVILEFVRVSSMDQSATTLLAELCEDIGKLGKKIIMTGTERHYHFVRFLKHYFRSSENMPALDFYDVDHALEYAEDLLLDEATQSPPREREVQLKDQSLCAGMDGDEIQYLQSLLNQERYMANDVICSEGQISDKLYFLASGRVSISIQIDSRRQRRLSAYTAGWSFGESALFPEYRRSARITADTEVTLYSLLPNQLESSEDSLSVGVRLKLYNNLSRITLGRLEKANREIRLLTG